MQVMKAQKILTQVAWIVLIAMILLGIPRLAGAIANLFDYAAFDPDGASILNRWVYKRAFLHKPSEAREKGVSKKLV
jgi:hypothetical protein